MGRKQTFDEKGGKQTFKFVFYIPVPVFNPNTRPSAHAYTVCLLPIAAILSETRCGVVIQQN